jgi:hypothetical protein
MFQRDWRTSNPKLHALYLGNALETLGIIQTAIEGLDELSTIHGSEAAASLRQVRAGWVKEDAAYFEAAAILYVGADWLAEAAKKD